MVGRGADGRGAAINGVGGASKGEYNSGVECVLKGNLLVELRYRKVGNEGRSKGGQEGGMYDKEGQRQVGRMVVGTHMANGSHKRLQ
jgi:hypothetical protein